MSRPGRAAHSHRSAHQSLKRWRDDAASQLSKFHLADFYTSLEDVRALKVSRTRTRSPLFKEGAEENEKSFQYDNRAVDSDRLFELFCCTPRCCRPIATGHSQPDNRAREGFYRGVAEQKQELLHGL